MVRTIDDSNHVDLKGDQTSPMQVPPQARGTSPPPSLRTVYPPPAPNRSSRPAHSETMASPYSTAGQYAFAPATQQTTVVTTTTTTVNLAPFVLQPPKSLRERDPKQYPLAYSSTPSSMKHIRFKVGDRMATFTEADDTNDFLGRYDIQQRRLENAKGSLRESERSQELGGTSTTVERSSRGTRSHASSRRIASPPSLAAAAELASSQRRKGKRKSHLSSLQGVDQDDEQLDHQGRALQSYFRDQISPVTPDTEVGPAHKRHRGLLDQDSSSSISRDSRAARAANSTRRSNNRRPPRSEQDDASIAAGTLAAATPPIMDSDVEADAPAPTSRESHPVLPSLLNTTSHQDASLPSPSLSPVTAAANLAQRQQQLTRRATDNDDVSDLSGLETDVPPKRKTPPLFDSQSSKSLTETGLGIGELVHAPSRPEGQSRTLMDVPEMILMFDSLPTELQSYVMFQFLKRSSKKTLRTVAEAVNPALKCDPFDTLPVEISLKITKFLDGQSMGRAAQVSKKWRHLVNSDETAWRDLLERDGFTLPDGEIERAIQEGWAWQYPGHSEYEKNLSHTGRKSSRASIRNEIDLPSARSTYSDEDTSSTARHTRKRKAAGPSTSSKRQKRKASTPHDEDTLWLRDLQKGQGPIACASAAARFVPDPKIGLPSLKSLHLFKSIYQRHWMIRKTWMDGTCQPHHLAFRAHHRHVVTCLLFDSDRIITGSDDTSINVFDTKTGILRKRLEGHEGGVWALSCDGNTLVSGSTDRSVRVWDINSGTCMQTFQGHTSTVRCLVILKPVEVGKDVDGEPIMQPEEPVIITGSRDSTLRVWKLPKPTDPIMHQAGPPENETDNTYALRTLSGHHNSVRAIAAHGDTLVSGSYDCTVRVWRISTGEMVHRLQGHSQKVYSVVLDHERGRCISGSMDNLVKVWSLDSGTCLFNLEGHTSLVGLLELNHGNLVSAAADSTLRVWDRDNGACKSVLSAHTGAITCFQHDGNKVISGSDRTLKMWNIETGECTRDLLTDLSGVWQVRFDERRCVAAVQRNNLTYIEVLDFGASRDGVPAADRGRRIVVDARGREVQDDPGEAIVPAGDAGALTGPDA